VTVIFPEPLDSAQAYEAEIQRLVQQIAATEEQLAQLRRERGCRMYQLRELEPAHPLVNGL
jgi:hypothetical protein